ncbi:MAG: hypothetical protein E7066_08630 [Lentimicrobiaceae bacterium]|nr:hypothetical protein [Lentimicrobiaceae bacterium]
MKTLLKILALAVCIPLFISAKPMDSHDTESYTIYKIYEKIELDNGAKVIDSWGNIEEAKAVLVPTEIDCGRYSVEITRISSNFYQICGTSLYIETKYCYEYATREEVLLNVTSTYGYNLGDVLFFE